MKTKKFTLILAILIILLTPLCSLKISKTETQSTSAEVKHVLTQEVDFPIYSQGAVLMEASTGKVLYGKNENGNPKRIYAYGATLKEAKENLKIKLDAYNRMGYQNLQNKMTVNELYDYWLKNEATNKSLKENTMHGYTGVYNNHIKPCLGHLYLKDINVKNINKVYEYIDNELIQYIDATDNMQLEYLESKIVPDFIKLCNPEWNENVDENEAFINALRLADEFWNIYIKHAIAEVEAIEIILKSSDECKECYLVFNVEMPYRKAIKYINNNKVKYIIFKSSREGYDIRILRDSCKFKDEISHEADINIAKQIIGIDDLIYVDVNGKLCCTKTLESAIKIVKYNEKMMEIK